MWDTRHTCLLCSSLRISICYLSKCRCRFQKNLNSFFMLLVVPLFLCFPVTIFYIFWLFLPVPIPVILLLFLSRFFGFSLLVSCSFPYFGLPCFVFIFIFELLIFILIIPHFVCTPLCNMPDACNIHNMVECSHTELVAIFLL